jgi:hypothetical protein
VLEQFGRRAVRTCRAAPIYRAVTARILLS